MNKQVLLTLLLALCVIFSASAIYASDVNATDSYATNLVDDTSDVSVPLENIADSSEISVSNDSNVDNDSSKVSLSSEEVLESENSNTLSTNTGSDVISGDSSSNTIDVSDSVVANNITKYYKGSTKYTATFLDEYGNPLANTTVQIVAAGQNYSKTTDSNGVVSLDIDLKPGLYAVAATNPVTGYKLTTTFQVLTTITASSITKVYTDARKFTATFYKSTGKVLANKNIKFKINGKTYTVKTNSNGVASLSLSTLKKGTYKIISYNTDGLTKTNKVKVVRSTSSELITSAYTFLKSDTKTIKVTLHNGLGYAPGAGKTVKFTINGKTYSAKTNSNGVASLKLPTLSVGVYTVKYNYAGNSFYTASSASNKVSIIPSSTPTFTVKSVTTFGQGANTPFKLAVTSGSVPLISKTITLKVNGTTYTKTTNSNGLVSLPIKLANGKYNISYSISKDSKINAKSGSTEITVKDRSNSSLTWSSGTSLSQGIQTLKVLLKDSNNKALASKTVTLTIDSKSYSATTSSTGYATFSVNLSPGNYTASYSYSASGDNDNAPSSGSAKISVVKKDDTGNGYWVFGADMKNVDLSSLASKGTTDLFLNYYAITLHGQSAVESWIASASKLGIRVHIWAQVFYGSNGWINPVANGKINSTLFTQKINELKKYANIKGVSGVHLDYLRYPGTAYKTTGGTDAITEFVKQATEAIHNIDASIIVSCALMPETTSNIYYYGQNLSAISQYVDVVIPMIYKGNYKQTTSWITTTAKWFVDNSNGAKVWAGLQAYNSDSDTTKLSTANLAKDALAASDSKVAGIMVFRWGLTNFVNFKNLTADASSNTTTAKTISVANIITGATNLKKYYETNSKLPNTVTAGGVTFTLPEFLYLMSQAIYQLGSSNTKAITYIIGVSSPSSPSGDSISANLMKADYLTTAKNVATFIKTYNQAPNYASSAVGKIIYSELVDAFSRILAFYGNNDKTMPNYVTIKYSSGSSSVSGSGLNEKNTVTDLSQYLKSTTNCQVNNSAIKKVVTSLISGLSSDAAKAKAIYNYVRDSISYSFYYNTKHGAAGTLSAKSGNCVDQSHLLVAMFRTAGLASRYVHGTCTFSSGSTYGHVWTQVLIDGKWTVADATSSRNSLGSIANWNTKTFSLKGIYSSISF